MVKFQWNGFKPKISAEVFGKTIQELQKKHNNRVLPKHIVELAKSPTSPLHRCFEWDDRVAGHAFRLAQAQKMLLSIRVVVPQAPEPQRFVARVKQGKDEKYTYAPMDYAMAQPELRSQVLDIALRELESYQKKYKHLSALAEVFEAFERVKAKIAPKPVRKLIKV